MVKKVTRFCHKKDATCTNIRPFWHPAEYQILNRRNIRSSRYTDILIRVFGIRADIQFSIRRLRDIQYQYLPDIRSVPGIQSFFL